MAVITTLSPWQKVSGPDSVMFAVGDEIVSTVITFDVAEQPVAFVTTTE